MIPLPGSQIKQLPVTLRIKFKSFLHIMACKGLYVLAQGYLRNHFFPLSSFKFPQPQQLPWRPWTFQAQHSLGVFKIPLTLCLVHSIQTAVWFVSSLYSNLWSKIPSLTTLLRTEYCSIRRTLFTLFFFKHLKLRDTILCHFFWSAYIVFPSLV